MPNLLDRFFVACKLHLWHEFYGFVRKDFLPYDSIVAGVVLRLIEYLGRRESLGSELLTLLIPINCSRLLLRLIKYRHWLDRACIADAADLEFFLRNPFYLYFPII